MKFYLSVLGVFLTLLVGIYVGSKIIQGAIGSEVRMLEDQMDTLVAQRDVAVADYKKVKAEMVANKKTVIAWDALSSYYTEESSGGVQANGKKFDETKLTVAHRTLPFGTMLILENPANGKLSPARVEDRGPALWTGRSLDVSLAVARRLGIIEQGEATVRCYMLIGAQLSQEN